MDCKYIVKMYLVSNQLVFVSLHIFIEKPHENTLIQQSTPTETELCKRQYKKQLLIDLDITEQTYLHIVGIFLVTQKQNTT